MRSVLIFSASAEASLHFTPNLLSSSAALTSIRTGITRLYLWLLFDRLRQLEGIDGMDYVNIFGDIFDFIPLQMSDHMPADILGRSSCFYGVPGYNSPKSLCPAFVQFQDIRFRFCLADSNQCDFDGSWLLRRQASAILSLTRSKLSVNN